MRNKQRLDVKIPDHEVLRKIGGGSYGEVWLARGVTGAWRAVKFVWREDFEDERGFEREFEGILKYEPISRNHPGLVHVLHVGRSKYDEDPFYYYVMELGDDVLTGEEINPVEYEARTLRSDFIAASGAPLDIHFCLDVARTLADALAYLHEKGLAHRDVKPANVIFVGDKAKLADIGLVAARGQMTFVGTEGFVPPEGPGSAQADIYSLGKVIYEMMTGKDRLQFPELPDDLPGGSERKLWLQLNQVICDICDPKLSKRSISTAVELRDAVQRIEEGKALKIKRDSRLLKVVAIGLVMLASMAALWLVNPWEQKDPVVRNPVPAATGNSGSPRSVHRVCAIKIHTTPAYATVFENGVQLEQPTPTDFREYAPGTTLHYRLELAGHRTMSFDYVVPDQELAVIDRVFDTFLPPIENQPWTDPLGVSYLPVNGEHKSGFVRKLAWEAFVKAAPQKEGFKLVPFSENGEAVEIVLMTRPVARAYVTWLENLSLEQGLLEDGQMIAAVHDIDLVTHGYGDEEKKAGLLPTRCVVKKIPYAEISVQSEPAGARVYVDGEWRGMTPMVLESLRPGPVDIELRMDGYKKFRGTLDLADNESRPLVALLNKNNGVIFGKNWKNSLGVAMVPVADGLMASIWEVRVSDYQLFASSTGHRSPMDAGFKQEPNHPVVGVSLEDAEAFCKWLTAKERAEEWISDKHRYKVPSDYEWSLLVGYKDDKDATPASREREAQHDDVLKKRYLWKGVYPPAIPVGNLAGMSSANAVGVPKSQTIPDYDDGYEKTSPVGTFPTNELGLYDLCGNVYEWVEDSYSDSEDWGVVRGGSWNSYAPNHLRIWSRFPITKVHRGNQFGFRVVLVDESERETKNQKSENDGTN